MESLLEEKEGDVALAGEIVGCYGNCAIAGNEWLSVC